MGREPILDNKWHDIDSEPRRQPIPLTANPKRPPEKPEKPSDKVTRPSHYEQFAIQPVTFIMKNKLPFWLGNVIKYGCRAGSKSYDMMTPEMSEITDIEKMIRYGQMRLNELTGKEANDA